ncbi:MAG: hypothetical protein IJV88_00860 [Ruminococcus sp.]|nr:hypothetical protein [Ruminococcus sp.]
MKRFIALLLSAILLLSLFACTDEGTDTPSGTDPATGTQDGVSDAQVIPEELQGKWYGPNSDPILEISPDGTGTVQYLEETFDATFSVEGDIFSVTSSGYNLSGCHTLEEELLYVDFSYSGTDYTLVFTRQPTELPQGSYIYVYEDKTYEITPEEGIVTEEEFPPLENPPTVYVFFYEKNEIIHILPHPPADYGKGEGSTTPPNGDTPAPPIPATLDTKTDPPTINIGGTDIVTSTTSDDITGTWSNENMPTDIYFFGVQTSTTSSLVYTFNGDGTGTVVAMGFIPGTLTYTCTDGVLNLTVSMLGEVESGTGYVKRVGDILYVQNMNGDILPLSKIG